MSWDYPVYTPAAAKSDGTDVVRAREALSRDEALRVIAGNDPRPLLVVRECAVCNKTDNALLQPGIDNEKTILLSRWFHCVKVPVDVLQPDHPFNALFPDKKSEHLFVSARDGSAKVPLESDTSRVALWGAMTKILANAYAKDPAESAKEIAKVFDRLDILDERLRDLERSRDDLLETPGKLDRDRVKKFEKEIAEAKQETANALRSIDRIAKIELKPAKKRERS